MSEGLKFGPLEEILFPPREGDLFWFQRMIDGWYTGTQLYHVLSDFSLGKTKPWRLTGNGMEGVLVTELFLHPSGLEVNVWGVAGKGYFRNLASVFGEGVEGYARSLQARWVGGTPRGNGHESGHSRTYRRLGYRAIGTVMVKELTYEQ